MRTRIPAWLLELARRSGASQTVILRNYPTLTAQDLATARNYVQTHRHEIEQQIRDDEAA